jgi:hypothetical protein
VSCRGTPNAFLAFAIRDAPVSLENRDNFSQAIRHFATSFGCGGALSTRFGRLTWEACGDKSVPSAGGPHDENKSLGLDWKNAFPTRKSVIKA